VLQTDQTDPLSQMHHAWRMRLRARERGARLWVGREGRCGTWGGTLLDNASCVEVGPSALTEQGMYCQERSHKGHLVGEARGQCSRV